MARDDDKQRFGSGPRKTTVYKNGKLVKDEMKASPKPKAKPQPKKAAPKKEDRVAKTIKTAKAGLDKADKATINKSPVPNTRTKDAKMKEVRRNAREIVDTTSPARSTKNKVPSNYTYEQWKTMSPTKRKSLGLPQTNLGVQTWGLKKGVMDK